MSSLLVFKTVYRLEIQSVMLVFSTHSCELAPLYPSNRLTYPRPPPPPRRAGEGGAGDVGMNRGGGLAGGGLVP
jgi:hypothetical protein